MNLFKAIYNKTGLSINDIAILIMLRLKNKLGSKHLYTLR
jgi:hypothetical protein